jgi:quinol monooxygenase YgiN
MINVIASIHVKEGNVSKFLEIFKDNVPNVLKEEGCIDYVPTVDAPTGLPPQELQENRVVILEKWESIDALKAHMKTPHMLAYREKVKDLIEKMSLNVLQEA